MHKSTSRRLFLRNSALAATGLTLFSGTSIVQAMTSGKCPYEGYCPLDMQINDIRVYSVEGPSVFLSGTLYDSNGLLPKTNTPVEIWHLSPNSEKFTHRGKTYTDNEGRYCFWTDFPNNEKGRSPRIYYKIGTSSSSYYTELILNETAAHVTGDHWVRNKVLDEKMYPHLFKNEGNFNVIFNMTL